MTREPGSAPATERVERPARPRRRTTVRREQGLLDRYRTVLIAGVAVAGLLLIGAMFMGGPGARAYECLDLMTPGPVEAPPTARPTASPSPSPTAEPSPDGSPAGSPGTDASPSPDAAPSPDASPTPAPSPAPEPTARLGFPATDLGRLHVPTGQPVTYAYCPPASGPHYNSGQPNPAPMQPAVYPPAQERSPGYWVHNLEHGYIVLLYRCPSGQLGQGDCISRDELTQLERFFEQAPEPPYSTCPNKTMVARFDSMTSRFALLAWDRALLVDEFDLDQALTFAEQWMEYDPIVLPERAAC
ncbi:MAG TPA: DUF3105 domain-containing protein [Candidatus Limnocylindrales bacterium]|jgi:hypothetical protein|nr:DUF3105 domain-containing protein [Candidatus Limnocylindrales bacterium]